MGFSIDNTGLWGPGDTEARIRTRAGDDQGMDLRGAGKQNEHSFALNICEIVFTKLPMMCQNDREQQ